MSAMKNVNLYGVRLINAELANAALKGGARVGDKIFGAELEYGYLIEGKVIDAKRDNTGRVPTSIALLKDILSNNEDYTPIRKRILKKGMLSAGLIISAELIETNDPDLKNTKITLNGTELSSWILTNVKLTGNLDNKQDMASDNLVGAKFEDQVGSAELI